MIQDFGKRASAWQETKKLPPEDLAQTGVRSDRVAVHARQSWERRVRKGMLSEQGQVGNQQDEGQRDEDQQDEDQQDEVQRDAGLRGPEFLKPEVPCFQRQLKSRRIPAKPLEQCAFRSSWRWQAWIRVGTAKSTFGTGE